jgi:hypothetical protein
MEKTCPSCFSCGMPFEKASDHALGDVNHKFCSHCTDSQGQLKPYEEILIGMVNYLMHSQDVSKAAAIEIAKGLLAEQPAWRD